jgi:2-oxoglutarate dehydrogenase complex dehydrogenase (E1) component-like enzyme
VLYNNCETKKIIPCDIVGILFVPIHEDLISPLVIISKKKYIRSAKESDNTIINTEKQQKLAEIAVNKN